MMVTYNSKVDMARSAGREYRFRSLVRNQIGQGFAVGLIVGIILASYLMATPLLLTVSRAGEVALKQTSNPASTRFVLIRRSVAQDQGAWIIDYQLRHTSPTGVILSRSGIRSVVEGWVSNSRVASHAVPRLSRVTVSGISAASGTGDVIVSSDESQRCRERVVISVWADDGPLPETDVAALVSLAPGAVVHLRLRLEHQHVLYGDYDPLLGVRTVALTLGSSSLRDQVALDREHYLAQPKYSWPEPPDDRRDTRHFVSSPDSLHLEAHIPAGWPQGIAPLGLPQIRTCTFAHTAPHIMSSLRDGSLSESALRLVPDAATVVVSWTRLWVSMHPPCFPPTVS